jgi:hypothetical protein
MDKEIQLIPLPDDFEGRVETGPVQFGDDWPGVFIRGDSAAYYAASIRAILEKYGEQMHRIMEIVPLVGLMEDLGSSNLINRQQ